MEEEVKIPQEKKKKNDTPSLPPGKKLYDKWRGEWVAVKSIRDPFSNKSMVTEWKFNRIESKPNKTGIPLTDKEADIFNSTRVLKVSKVQTEQLYPHGSVEDIIFKEDFTQNL